MAGRAWAGGTPSQSIDLAVYLEPSVPQTRFPEASLELGERLSAASEEVVNVLVLNGARLTVQWSVCSRDEPARKAFEARTRRQYEE